jgi:hypothetical protein
LTEFELVRCSIDIIEPSFTNCVLRVVPDFENLQHLFLDPDTFIAVASQLPVMKSLLSLHLGSGTFRSIALPSSLSISTTVFPALQTITGSQDDVIVQILTRLIPIVGHSIAHFETRRTTMLDWGITKPVSLDRLFNALNDSCASLQSCKMPRMVFVDDYTGRYAHPSHLLPMRLHSGLIRLELSSTRHKSFIIRRAHCRIREIVPSLGNPPSRR